MNNEFSKEELETALKVAQKILSFILVFPNILIVKNLIEDFIYSLEKEIKETENETT